ncbi:MAG: NDP-hexose 2,3-dehydratase [Flavobacterium sp.]|nr:MAG: NDP-hexose 2,3-dehydratase [Flavobacterium sp.]
MNQPFNANPSAANQLAKANVSFDFLKSALASEGRFHTIEGVTTWLKQRNDAIRVDVEKIPFAEMDHWKFDRERGMLRHETGRFFSIEGINVKTNWGKVAEWDQPIINQPEIGYLGIITKEFDGILYFLLQAKIEPGNVNNVQLSPTLQATKSNYTQVHKGKKPRYLEYFQHATPAQIMIDQLQSEQGARFLRKRNRNMIIRIEEDIDVHEDFIWLTLGQIKELIKRDNLVNMDTRTVISGIPFGEFDDKTLDLMYSLTYSGKHNDFGFEMLRSSVNLSQSLFSFDEILNWMSAIKCHFELQITQKSIFETRCWHVTDREIIEDQARFFKVIAARVAISNREVTSWTQPLVEPMQHGLIAFITKKINGINHFLVQAKLEPGNFDILEMAPTVQCITGSYKNSQDVPFLEYVLNTPQSQIRHDSLQSEEGGRFFREQNRNLIIEAGSGFPEEVPANFKWISLGQLTTFLKFNNYLNIQSRSLLSAIHFI